jgi:hypothetical protein
LPVGVTEIDNDEGITNDAAEVTSDTEIDEAEKDGIERTVWYGVWCVVLWWQFSLRRLRLQMDVGDGCESESD